MMECNCLVTIFCLTVATVEGYSGLQILITDVAEAKPLVGKSDFIWEPTLPSEEFFILGQYLGRQRSRPPTDTELIVGRSDNGSLAEPLDFHGFWKIKPDLVIWNMVCPEGYVSLGAIATHQEIKPDVTKYGCVIKEETIKAELWAQLYDTPSVSVYSLYSPRGWRNIFFVIKNKEQQSNITAYTLKKAPLSMKSFIAKEKSMIKTQKKTTRQTKELQAKDSQLNGANANANTYVKSYTVLVICGVFMAIVITVFIVLCLLRGQAKHERLPTSSKGHTITTALSREYASDADSNTSKSEISKKKHFSSDSSRIDSYLRAGVKPEIRNNALYELHKVNHELKPNVLYHTVINPNNKENEYEVINADPKYRIEVGESPKIDRSSGIYSFAA